MFINSFFIFFVGNHIKDIQHFHAMLHDFMQREQKYSS
ncbi:hypothetical protein BSI_05930 [Bacillus inaquosorum KCTC 13429]|uniref:Uncharacterized protein n=1 Tax=Bacillus inaquosorum KCTC 13429 TaxID=1236548 RepID=A0A9W5LM11_9BACI|nr:hypothetical protein BSI_05930 [Bacillus inaquosorum KCTC 13429]